MNNFNCIVLVIFITCVSTIFAVKVNLMFKKITTIEKQLTDPNTLTFNINIDTDPNEINNIVLELSFDEFKIKNVVKEGGMQ